MSPAVKNIIILCTLLTFCLTTISLQAATNRISPLGINTNEAMDINGSVPFIDLFHLSSPFEESRPWLTKGQVVYDPEGWPSQLVNNAQAGTRFINNLPVLSIPVGTYTVLYDGRGKIRYGGNVQLLSHNEGKDLIRIVPNKEHRITATLTITETDQNNYIRNIRILMPGGVCRGKPNVRVRDERGCGAHNYLSFANHHKDLVFNPDYLNFMKDFRVIRFMNMAGITRNDISSWNDRPKVTDATWGGKEGVRGIPLEIIIRLANQIKADPWLNLPHRADNHYVHMYARTVKKLLNPNLKTYIEYTNEAWNGIFSQAHYIQDQGVRLRLDKNRTYAGFKYYSKRSVEIFGIWEREFGNNHRLIRVMGGMATNVTMTHMLLGYQNAFRHVDALAIAPYFHASQEDLKRVKSVNQVFKLLASPENKYSIPNTMKIVKAQADIVKQYGVDLVAYEGGQHLVAYGTHSNKEGSNPFLIAANKDQRMAQLYYNFLRDWKAVGGKMFVAFSAPRDYNWIGSWGIKEYITQNINQAPKYRGLMYFQKNNRCWWKDCATTRPVARKAKPAKNPAIAVMASRFKPVEPKVVSIRPIQRDAKRKATLIAKTGE